MKIYDDSLVKEILEKRDKGLDYFEDVKTFVRMHDDRIKQYIIFRLKTNEGTDAFKNTYKRALRVTTDAFKTYDASKGSTFKTYLNNYYSWKLYVSPLKSTDIKIHRYIEMYRKNNNNQVPDPKELEQYITEIRKNKYKVSLKRIVIHYQKYESDYDVSDYNHLFMPKIKSKNTSDNENGEEEYLFSLYKKSLTPTERKAYKLRVINGYKVKEVAQIMNLKPNTISKAIKMARYRLYAKKIENK